MLLTTSMPFPMAMLSLMEVKELLWLLNARKYIVTTLEMSRQLFREFFYIIKSCTPIATLFFSDGT